jgi:hypothetical protein
MALNILSSLFFPEIVGNVVSFMTKEYSDYCYYSSVMPRQLREYYHIACPPCVTRDCSDDPITVTAIPYIKLRSKADLEAFIEPNRPYVIKVTPTLFMSLAAISDKAIRIDIITSPVDTNAFVDHLLDIVKYEFTCVIVIRPSHIDMILRPSTKGCRITFTIKYQECIPEKLAPFISDIISHSKYGCVDISQCDNIVTASVSTPLNIKGLRWGQLKELCVIGKICEQEVDLSRLTSIEKFTISSGVSVDLSLLPTDKLKKVGIKYSKVTGMFDAAPVLESAKFNEVTIASQLCDMPCLKEVDLTDCNITLGSTPQLEVIYVDGTFPGYINMPLLYSLTLSSYDEDKIGELPMLTYLEINTPTSMPIKTFRSLQTLVLSGDCGEADIAPQPSIRRVEYDCPLRPEAVARIFGGRPYQELSEVYVRAMPAE